MTHVAPVVANQANARVAVAAPNAAAARAAAKPRHRAFEKQRKRPLQRWKGRLRMAYSICQAG